MWCISFPYDYLSSAASPPPDKTTTTRMRRVQNTKFRGIKVKTAKMQKCMKKPSVFEWLILLQCFVSILLSGFYDNHSLLASAKTVKDREKNDLDEDNVRLLSYLDNENQISLESLENISPAKLIGHNDSSEDNDQNNENALDDINKILQMDSPRTHRDEKTTSMAGN